MSETAAETDDAPTRREWASDLAERIEADEVDPDDVDLRAIAYDDGKTLTPALADALGPERVEEYSEYNSEKLQDAIDRETRGRSGGIREKLELIEDAVGGGEEDLTETVPFGEGAEVEVLKELPESVKRGVIQLQEIDDIGSIEDYDSAVETVIDVIVGVLADEEWADRELWRARYEEVASDDRDAFLDLNKIAWELVQPALTHGEQVRDSFRERQRDLDSGGL